MLKNIYQFNVFWILILHRLDDSKRVQATFPVQTFVGWNASFNMQLDPYPSNDSVIQIIKNSTVIMLVKGTQSRDVAERFEFTGNTFDNRISFILRNVTLGDAGTYNATDVLVISGGKQTLIVKASPSKPHIIELTGSAVSGSAYSLNCSCMSNSAPPDHGLFMMSEWKVNDQIITAVGQYEVNRTELTIASISRQDNGTKLICVAYEDSQAKSVPSTEYVIDVKYGPDNIQLNPSGGIIKAIEHHSVSIQCTADCNPTCSFQWRRGSVPGYLKTNQTLMIDSVDKSDTDNYTCTVSNSITGRSQSLPTTLIVIYGAEIVNLSVHDSNIVNENSSAIFQCQVDSNPLPTISWTKEGTNAVLKTETGVVQNQFRIVSAQCQDTDNYTCSAYNGIWTQANGTLQFFVKCHPRTDSEVPPETKVYKKLHEAAFLRYTVISYPLPKFTWMFLGNGSEIKDLPGSASHYVNGRQSELRFTSLNIDDFGYYSVVADNSLPPSAREVFEIILTESAADPIGNVLIPAIAGGTGASAVFILLAFVAIFLWRRHEHPNQQAAASPPAISMNQGATGSEYAVGVKTKKKAAPAEDQYKLQVDKSPKMKMTGDIYENAELALRNVCGEKEYENSMSVKTGTSGEKLYEDPAATSSNVRMVNKEGLMYADIMLNPPTTKHGKLNIQGIEDRTQYAEIAYGKRGEPLHDIDIAKENIN